jgi:hypothetical protein
MEDISVKNIFASSENRDSNLYPYGNSYTLYLGTPIKQIKKVELVSASIPNTLYNITNGSNLMSLSNVAGNFVKFSIPNGFYSAAGLASEIVMAAGNATGVSVQYITNEGKMLFTNTSTQFKMIINTTELAPLLGFSTSDVGQVITSQIVATSTSQVLPLYSDNSQYRGLYWIKSSQVVTMSPIDGVFLDIQELRNNTNEDAQALVSSGSQNYATVSGSTASRTFGIIPLDVPSGTIKWFKKYTDYDLTVEFPYPIQRLDRLTVRWTDIDGNLLSFNGLEDNSFVLRFHTLNLK